MGRFGRWCLNLPRLPDRRERRPRPCRRQRRRGAGAAAGLPRPEPAATALQVTLGGAAEMAEGERPLRLQPTAGEPLTLGELRGGAAPVALGPEGPLVNLVEGGRVRCASGLWPPSAHEQ